MPWIKRPSRRIAALGLERAIAARGAGVVAAGADAAQVGEAISAALGAWGDVVGDGGRLAAAGGDASRLAAQAFGPKALPLGGAVVGVRHEAPQRKTPSPSREPGAIRDDACGHTFDRAVMSSVMLGEPIKRGE
jgi:hypothetical protein